MTHVRTGLEMLLDERPIDLASARIGVLSNQASVTSQFVSSCDAIAAAYPDQLRALFSPQHGFWSEQQANMIESAHDRHPVLDVPIHSLYSETRRPSSDMLAAIDVLFIDLQDVGTRVYTFVWTMLNCLRACADADVEVIVLDRPNPLGGLVSEGAVLHSDFRSFVGDACIPMRHGLTIGELALLLDESLGIGATLQVVPLQNWNRCQRLSATGLPWVPPSPNLPTLASAIVYPGQVLLEGTNLSEGRGTTTPFEVIGAPFIDAYRLADALNNASLEGVHFRPMRFRPTFDKWAGEICGGVAIHVTDADRYQPYRTTLQLLSTVRQLASNDFAWLDPPYEYEQVLMPIDILNGDGRLRTWLDEQGCLDPAQLDQLCNDGVSEWRRETQRFSLYAAD